MDCKDYQDYMIQYRFQQLRPICFLYSTPKQSADRSLPNLLFPVAWVCFIWLFVLSYLNYFFANVELNLTKCRIFLKIWSQLIFQLSIYTTLTFKHNHTNFICSSCRNCALTLSYQYYIHISKSRFATLPFFNHIRLPPHCKAERVLWNWFCQYVMRSVCQ